MKEQLKQIDMILSEIHVKGDDVFRMVEVRKILNELYKKESE